MASLSQTAELLTSTISGLTNRLTSLRNAAARACTGVIPPEMARIHADAILDSADLRTPPLPEIAMGCVSYEVVDDPARPRPQVEQFIDMDRITRVDPFPEELTRNTALAIGTITTVTVDFDDEDSMVDLALDVMGLSDYRIHMNVEQRRAFGGSVYGHFTYISDNLHNATPDEMIRIVHTEMPYLSHQFFVYEGELHMTMTFLTNGHVIDMVVAQALEFAMYVREDESMVPTLELRGASLIRQFPMPSYVEILSASRLNANLPAFTADQVRTLFFREE